LITLTVAIFTEIGLRCAMLFSLFFWWVYIL